MPRVCIPNATLIANADLPILPFLAPRVYRDVSVTRGPRTRNGRRHGIQKQGTAEEPRAKQIRASHGEIEARRHGWTRGASSSLPPAHTSSSAVTPHKFLRVDTRSRSSVDCLYADISIVGRQQIRNHSTAASATRPITIPLASSPGDSRDTIPVFDSTEDSSRSNAFSSKRTSALARERERLRIFLSRLPQLSEKELLRKGQYRSLRRRIANIVHWNIHTVDLSKDDAAHRLGPWLLRAFAALDRTAFARVGQRARKIRIIHDPLCAKWSATLFEGVEQEGYHRMWRNWTALKSSSCVSGWHKLLIYLLDLEPGRALRFMQVLANETLVKNDLDHAIIADALGHLSRLHLTGEYAVNQGWDTVSDANKRAFLPAFHHIFSRKLGQDSDVCSQDLLHNIARLASIDDLKKTFDLIVRERTYLGYDTLLHYANAFGEAGELQYAVQCLDELRIRNNAASWEKVVDRKRLRWTCALILRKSMQRGENYHETPEIVANFVKKGIRFDILLYNVVMRNAMEAGDYSTAFKVYNALEENSIKPDMHTFSILLHGCTMQNNPAMFSEFAVHCAQVAKESQDPWLATDYLHYLEVRHEGSSDLEYTSSVLWRAYLNHFSAAPLKPLINLGRSTLRGAIEAQQSSSKTTLLEPLTLALYIMLQTEIRTAMAVGSQRVVNLCEHFTLLASQDSASALGKLAGQPAIWNAFLHAFCLKQQFASASQLIRTMTETGPQPNVYTWNIFMQAFFKTGQVQAADRVSEIMRNRGIDPDQYTYGVMLRGYAKAQLVERIGDTMQHVNAEQELDPDLLRALATVVNRADLMKALEESRLKKGEYEHAQTTKLAEEERLRWEHPDAPSDHLGTSVDALGGEEPSFAAAEHDLESVGNERGPEADPDQTAKPDEQGTSYTQAQMPLVFVTQYPASAQEHTQPRIVKLSYEPKLNIKRVLHDPSVTARRDLHSSSPQQ